MNDFAIEFENVSKKFKTGENVNSLRDLVPALAKKVMFRRRKRVDELSGREFWALRDVSFGVARGETVGIIGPNGAGKSTILKILSGIIRPTIGHYRVNGRLSALIEVGAGFHQDLTGRENIYLNGSILGMSPKEISAKFDEIVEFCGLDKFIDTPVKRYSSGMYARLGFSVAVHVNPDILLVDEVLSVGDMVFQAKCQKKMREVGSSGTTIVFITHNMSALASLCKETLVLQQGQVFFKGRTSEAIKRYFDLANNLESVSGKRGLRLTRAEISDESGQQRPVFQSGERFQVKLDFVAQEKMNKVDVGIWMRGPNGDLIFDVTIARMHTDLLNLTPGQRFGVIFYLTANLCSGSYILGVGGKRCDLDLHCLLVEPAASIEVVGADASAGVVWLSPSSTVVLNTHGDEAKEMSNLLHRGESVTS